MRAGIRRRYCGDYREFVGDAVEATVAKVDPVQRHRSADGPVAKAVLGHHHPQDAVDGVEGCRAGRLELKGATYNDGVRRVEVR